MSISRSAALAAICDTLIARMDRPDDADGYWARSASDLGIAPRIEALLAGAKAEDQAQFNQLLTLLASPLLGLTWWGPLRPAHRLTPEQRNAMLLSWSRSALPLLRNAYNTLRKAAGFLYYGDVPAGQSENPNWAAIGYQREMAQVQPDPEPLAVLPITSDTLSCDTLIIGSGSGGGVIAARLAAAGQDVLVVEKGGYTPRGDYNQREFPMMHQHYEAGALLATQDGAVTVLAGSTVGGGSAINWAGMLRTPDDVLEEWANQHHNPQFLTPEFRAGFDAIEQRTSVNTRYIHNPQNQGLFDAARQLGWQVGPIPINMKPPEHLSPDLAWRAMGFSSLGDAYGIKQSVPETFLRDAQRQGARLLTHVQIQRILIKNGQAVGAEGTLTQPGQTPRAINIQAKKVVVCAGSLHTPVLLKKSGLTHPQIGRNLYLHPVVPVAAFYPHDIAAWNGPMMTTVVQEFTRLHDNWGFRLECPPVHPGLAASTLPWESAEQYKTDMKRLRQLGVHICLVRDRFGGHVTVGKQSGEPVLHYQLHDYDKRHLVLAMQRSVEAHIAAGAERVSILHNQPLHYFPGKTTETVADFQEKIAARSWAANRMGLYSAHQMGTCRMGGTHSHPVKPNGETREVKGLYVGDASLFPSASGANPMLTVKALAWYVGGNLLNDE